MGVLQVQDLSHGLSCIGYHVSNDAYTHRYDKGLQLCRLSDMQPVAIWLNQQLWNILQQTVGFSIPRRGEGRGWDIVLQVPGRDQRTYQELVVRQPIKTGGIGLRSLVETSPVAYLGALDTAIHSVCREDKISPLLQDVVGGDESWGP